MAGFLKCNYCSLRQAESQSSSLKWCPCPVLRPPQRQAVGPRWAQRVVYLLAVLPRAGAHLRRHRLHVQHRHLVGRLRAGRAVTGPAHLPGGQRRGPARRDHQGTYIEGMSSGSIGRDSIQEMRRKMPPFPKRIIHNCNRYLIMNLLASGSWNSDKGADPRDEPQLHRVQIPTD